jgi:hypothetical protein
VICDDHNLCTDDSCNTADGTCTHAQVTCDDDNACTADSCSTADGTCTNTPTPGASCGENGNQCCDETGGCGDCARPGIAIDKVTITTDGGTAVDGKRPSWRELQLPGNTLSRIRAMLLLRVSRLPTASLWA